MKISVLGSGRWATFIAWYLSGIGHSITVFARPDSERSRNFLSKRGNDLITLDCDTVITQDIECALDTDTVIISISSQHLREFSEALSKFSQGRDRRFVLCMKGLEEESGKRLTQVFAEGYGKNAKTAVWLGPGHVQDFLANIPNCMVIDSEDFNLKAELCDAFSSSLIRFYYGDDLIGNEIGAAAKNVVGIAAGMLDALGLFSLKGALMARGSKEVSRLIEKAGGNPMSAYGLCHLGDYEATVFSPYSHNRAFGEAFVRGEIYPKLAEGVMTCKAMKVLGQKCSEELPICTAVHRVVFEGADAKETLGQLFSRELKREFY